MIGGGAYADPSVKVSGYGTVGVASANRDGLQLRSSLSQSQGADGKPDFGVDSRLGLQGVATINPEWSVTAQLLGERRRTDSSATSNDDFDVGFEWLFGQYAPTSNLSLRAGRVVLPAFMISDSRNVGYAQPWLRAPMEVYGGMPLTTLDGVQALWRIPVGPATITVQPSYGGSSYNLVASNLVIKSRATNVKSLNLMGEYGDWTVRYGLVIGTSKNLQLGLLNAIPGFSALPPVEYDMKDRFTSLGLQYDDGTALFMAEWARRKQNNLPAAPALYNAIPIPGGGGATVGDIYTYGIPGLLPGFAGRPLAMNTSYYVGGGWHFGKWLPMLVYGHTKDDQNLSPTMHSITASVRYDLTNGVALKAQAGRVDARDGFSFANPDPDASNRKVTVLGLAVDFVF
jgi:hypothetical protein